MNLVLLFESDFIPGTNTAVLKDRRLRHVVDTHRSSEGDCLKVGIVNGRTGTGLITSIDNKSLQMEVSLNSEPPPPLPLNLIIALPRPKVLNRVIAAVSSMGVKKIWLINTFKVEKSYWQSPRLSEENLVFQSVLGLEQAKDTVMPTIFLKKRFKPFVEDDLPDISSGTIALTADPSGEKFPPSNLNTPVTLAIGPEGGFTSYETDMLCRTGFSTISMGKRIFRIETAIPALIYRLFSSDLF